MILQVGTSIVGITMMVWVSIPHIGTYPAVGLRGLEGLSGLSRTLVSEAMWEFPKIGDPNIIVP